MSPSKPEERILIIAPIGQDAAAMAALLNGQGFASEVCDGPVEACQQLSAGAAALLLTEEALELPQIRDLIEQIKAQPPWSELPVILLVGSGESRLARVLDATATAAGSLILLERPIGASTLIRSVEVAMRSRRRQYQVRDLIKDKARLAAIVESSQDAIISKDLNGIIVSWNHAAERLFGYTSAEAMGNPITILFPRERLSEEPDILLRIKRGECIQPFETVRQRKDGTLVDISLAISPIVGTGGIIIGASKIVRDITERRQAEAALRENQTRLEMALEAAEAAARAKDQFMAALSHELRTPLTPVLITAAMLREDETLPEEVRKGLEVIEQNIEIQARMVDDLLDHSRIINNKLELAMGPCNLRVIIQRALDVCRAGASQKGIGIRLELDARQHQLNADAMRLQQVFWNLIQNAIKFTPPGGKITIASHSGGDRVEVSVTDTGCGIDPTLLEVIFNPFEQVQQRSGSSGAQRGLGLGLAIARRVVAAHGGTITATSRGKGSGTKFVVSLPVTPP